MTEFKGNVRPTLAIVLAAFAAYSLLLWADKQSIIFLPASIVLLIATFSILLDWDEGVVRFIRQCRRMRSIKRARKERNRAKERVRRQLTGGYHR